MPAEIAAAPALAGQQVYTYAVVHPIYGEIRSGLGGGAKRLWGFEGHVLRDDVVSAARSTSWTDGRTLDLSALSGAGCAAAGSVARATGCDEGLWPSAFVAGEEPATKPGRIVGL